MALGRRPGAGDYVLAFLANAIPGYFQGKANASGARAKDQKDIRNKNIDVLIEQYKSGNEEAGQMLNKFGMELPMVKAPEVPQEKTFGGQTTSILGSDRSYPVMDFAPTLGEEAKRPVTPVKDIKQMYDNNDKLKALRTLGAEYKIPMDRQNAIGRAYGLDIPLTPDEKAKEALTKSRETRSEYDKNRTLNIWGQKNSRDIQDRINNLSNMESLIRNSIKNNMDYFGEPIDRDKYESDNSQLDVIMNEMYDLNSLLKEKTGSPKQTIKPKETKTENKWDKYAD